MSRRIFIAFLDANLGLEHVEGIFGGLEVKLVGEKTLQVDGDKVRNPKFPPPLEKSEDESIF